MVKYYKSFRVEIIDELESGLDAFELEALYQNQYPKDLMIPEQKFKPTSIHGINISTNGVQIVNALLSETAGKTIISEDSFIIKHDYLYIICSNYVYCLDIKTLSCKWRNQFDWATCFGIYEFADAMVVHGESTITMLNSKGNTIWSFSGDDIFLNTEGEQAFKIHNHQIQLVDFNGNHYTLNANGELIKKASNYRGS